MLFVPGMQHTVLFGAEPRGLPLSEKLLPQYLKDLGYRTHLVGKWHLGSYKREYLPMYRGCVLPMLDTKIPVSLESILTGDGDFSAQKSESPHYCIFPPVCNKICYTYFV